MSGIQLMLVGGGGAAPFKFTISSNQTNANLAALAITAGWDQAKAVEATVEAEEVDAFLIVIFAVPLVDPAKLHR